MMRLFSLICVLAVSLSACTTPEPAEPRMGADGKPLPRLYRIGFGDKSEIQYRMLDAVNSLRQASGAQPVKLNSRLNAAADTHSRDMSRQNRPWHFGSDGSSPLERVQRIGYDGVFLGENISETYETELQTLSAWMEEESTKRVILNKQANDMGFAWHQESNGKIWWTLIMGDGSKSAEAQVTE
ncbi:MAG: CAP domain-containing protein [Sediminimonas qiaohouensis]|uniref:CAP domain-containing protein n=1 Tax=Sediminimonas qiaohouensis TaxID=552061 RepID=A0A7C9L7Q7_9RHOB|nr:CAP domain-containing protein [Sediminimonas qiaohouensis]MTJ04693.1 CAP domain-containing protein [Sediminimonas qiaohouensis]